MALEYFCWFHSYRKKCEKLTDQELGRLVRSLALYSETGERQELAGRESIAFDFIAEDIDRSKEAYQEKVEKTKAAAKVRYMRMHADACERMHTHADEGKEKQESKTETKVSSNEETKKGARARFSPPSVDDVRNYCFERKNGIDAEQFVDFYAAKGWKIGNQTMKDWKASVRTWEKRKKADNGGKGWSFDDF